MSRVSVFILGVCCFFLMGQAVKFFDPTDSKYHTAERQQNPFPMYESLHAIGVDVTICASGSATTLESHPNARQCCIANEDGTIVAEWALSGALTPGSGKYIGPNGGGECIAVKNNCNEIDCAGRSGSARISYSVYGVDP